MAFVSYRNSSLDDSVQMPPHDVFERKSTGLVTCGLMGNRRKKSNSAELISSFINRICLDFIVSHENCDFLCTVKIDFSTFFSPEKQFAMRISAYHTRINLKMRENCGSDKWKAEKGDYTHTHPHPHPPRDVY